LNGGETAGIVIGSVAFAAIVAFIGLYVYRTHTGAKFPTRR
jgi:hypothetical protein